MEGLGKGLDNGLEFNSIFVGNKTLSAKVQSFGNPP